MYQRLLAFMLIALLAAPSAATAGGATSAPAAVPPLSPAQVKEALNNPLVLDNLAVIYAEGRGVPQDYAKAALCFQRAAERGDAFAEYSLGYLYMLGKGVPRDYTLAARWYRKAAQQGDVKAQYHLGTLYYLGIGVPKDYTQAVSWLTKAANRGDPEAMYYLRRITAHPAAGGRGLQAIAGPDPALDPTQQTADGLELTGLLGEGVPVGLEMTMVVIVPLLAAFGL
jgi:TPR repeat protein